MLWFLIWFYVDSFLPWWTVGTGPTFRPLVNLKCIITVVIILLEMGNICRNDVYAKFLDVCFELIEEKIIKFSTIRPKLSIFIKDLNGQSISLSKEKSFWYKWIVIPRMTYSCLVKCIALRQSQYSSFIGLQPKVLTKPRTCLTILCKYELTADKGIPACMKH